MNDNETGRGSYYVSVIIALTLGMIFGSVLALCLSILIWYII